MRRYIRRYKRYFTHKITESIDIPYFFICEQCMRDSGPLNATVSADAKLQTFRSVRTLNNAQMRKLRGAAHKNLVRAVKSARNDAEKKQIYSPAFFDECPYCRSPQSWAIGAIKKDMLSMPIVLLLLGIIFGTGCFFLSKAENARIIGIIIAAAFLLCAAGFLSVNLFRLKRRQDQLSPVTKRNTPVIDWRSVQNILY